MEEGKIKMVRKNVYQSNIVDGKEENVTSSQNLFVTEEMMRAIEQGNLDEVLQILEETQGTEFIELSKSLWKWLLTKMLTKETPILDIQPVTEEENDSEVDDFVEEELPPEETKEQVGIPIPKEKKIIEQEEITLDELLDCFYLNLESDPIVAKEYLMRYKKLCEKQNIVFNYNLLTLVEKNVVNVGVPSQQLELEKELFHQIRKSLKGSLKETEFRNAIEEFDRLYQNRGAWSYIYHGLYEQRIGNYSLASSYFRKALEVEPWNYKALRNLIYVLYCDKKFWETPIAAKRLLKYYPDTYDWQVRYELARSYIGLIDAEKSKLLRELSNFEAYDDQSMKSREKYLEMVIKKLEKEIIFRQKNLDFMDERNIASEVKKIDLLIRELEYHEEAFDCFQISSQEIKEAITEEDRIVDYLSEIIDFMNCNSNGTINFSDVEKCINELEIEEEERLFYYLVAARVFLLNHYPKQAEHYLKLVRSTKNKPESIKKQYEQLERNKTLYLNKNR